MVCTTGCETAVWISLQKPWPLNSLELNPLHYYIWGNVRGLSQALSKTEDIAKLEQMLK